MASPLLLLSDVCLLLLLLLLQAVLSGVRDASLRHCLQFGVGLHHAGTQRYGLVVRDGV